MRKFRPTDHILNPQRILFDLIKEYSDGKLNPQLFLRARVEEIDTVGGQIEANPPNPVNAIRARILTNGMDYNVPYEALSVFYPIIPGGSIAVGEHVLVLFEDGANYSNGLWLCAVPQFAQSVNYNNPENFYQPEQTATAPFRSDEPQRTEVNPDLEYGGRRNQQDANRRQVAVHHTESPFWKGKRVLIVGDELLFGFFGSEMTIKLRRKGVSDVKLMGFYDASSEMWLDGKGRVPKPFKSVFAEEKPEIVIFFLGLNDKRGTSLKSVIKGKAGPKPQAPVVLYSDVVSKLFSVANAQVPTLWIGPPKVYGKALRESLLAGTDRNKEIEEIISIQKSVIPASQYIDSSKETGEFGRKDDGINFDLKSLERLTDKVANR